MVALGCASGFGQGGLGKHLEFVYRSASLSGRQAEVYCRPTVVRDGFHGVAPPGWERFVPYSPVRWLPALHVYESGNQFDRMVERRLEERRRVVYHSFPGYAEHTFRKVLRAGGAAVLEAASTHVCELVESTSQEHRAFRMGGSPFSASWVRKVLREYELADLIAVSSRHQRDTFLQAGIPARKLLLAPLGVDTRRYAPAAGQASTRPRAQGEPFRIVQIGQVSLLKGFPYVLEAARSLGDPNLEITLFGGVGWRAIRKLIEHYRTEGLQIRLASGDPLPALREAHLCVHASVTDGFGLAPLEAMSAGVPVIVSTGTGMKDAVRDGVSGYVVPRRDSSCLAERIRALMLDETFRLRMGMEARNDALAYDEEERARSYGELMTPLWNSVS